MDALPQDSVILLRRGNKSGPGRFETLLREIVRQYAWHLDIRWMLPEPDGGPGATFNRDNEMVAMSDLVLAFFEPGHTMSGGTGHVVETAIDRNIPTYSFAMSEDSALTRVGDHDPDALWQKTVEVYFPK